MPISALFSCLINVFFFTLYLFFKKFLKFFFVSMCQFSSGIWVQVRGLGHKASLLARLFFFDFFVKF